MSANIKEDRINYIILCDARSLVSRISGRKDEYISIFALKRTRDHFEQIFTNNLDKITPELLLYCSEELIDIFYRFCERVEELKWYLIYTDDMPNAVDENITHMIHHVEDTFGELSNLITADALSDLDISAQNSDLEEEAELMPPVPDLMDS